MFLVDFIRAEEGVAAEVALDGAGRVEGDERTEGELRADFAAVDCDKVPLCANKREVFTFDILF